MVLQYIDCDPNRAIADIIESVDYGRIGPILNRDIGSLSVVQIVSHYIHTERSRSKNLMLSLIRENIGEITETMWREIYTITIQSGSQGVDWVHDMIKRTNRLVQERPRYMIDSSSPVSCLDRFVLNQDRAASEILDLWSQNLNQDERESVESWLSGRETPRWETLEGPLATDSVEMCSGASPDRIRSGDIGCRMLTCDCIIDHDGGWFNGRCDVCGTLIPNRTRAVRYCSDGMWWGCHCSRDCLIISTRDTYEDPISIADRLFQRLESQKIVDLV